jgi:hypothetical protein
MDWVVRGTKKALSGEAQGVGMVASGCSARVYPCPEREPIMIAIIIMEVAEIERMRGLNAEERIIGQGADLPRSVFGLSDRLLRTRSTSRECVAIQLPVVI